MKTNELILKVLRDVRFNVMSKSDISLNDFVEGSKGYDLMVAFNEASNKLSFLIDLMEYESKC